MNTARKAVTAAAVIWFIAAVMSFCLPFILGGTWGMLGGPGVLLIIGWALTQMALCLWQSVTCLIWTAETRA